LPGSKATVVTFATDSSTILTGHESGKVSLWDAETGKEVASNEEGHTDQITDLQLSPDRTYFVTASKDKTARVSLVLLFKLRTILTLPFSKLYDTKTLAVIKTYSTETPLNSAAIAPLKPYVCSHPS
jgi:translation initiation factor 3 subunit I